MTVVATAFVACSSDNDIIEEPQQSTGVKTYTMTVQATKGDDAANSRETRALAFDGSTLNATWAKGEKVTVYNKTKSAAIEGYLSATSNGANTTLSGSLTGTIDEGDELTLKFLSPDYTGQDGTLAYIAAHCDYAEAEVTVSAITDGKITTTGNANFSNKQAIVKFTVIDKEDGTTKLNPSVFNIYIAYLTPNKIQLSIPGSTYTTNGDGVIYVAIPQVWDRKVTIIASANSKTYAYIKDVARFREGKYYAVNVKMSHVEGLFTVNSDASVHQIVTFSPGNLRATTTDSGANWTWSFAEHQYDFIGNAAANTLINGNGTVSDNGTVDLFGWSTNSTYYGINPSSTDGDGDYSGAFVDWGKLVIGFDAADTWRTLTVNEWNYIFSKRSAATVSGTENARYAKATINTDGTPVKGVILIPDFYAAGTPDGVTWGAINTDYDLFTTSCTTAGWGVLEAAGCVFLPSGGYRNGVSIDMSENYGGYWSASSGSTGTLISYLFFRDNNTNPWSEDHRHRGHSVRLVKNFNF